MRPRRAVRRRGGGGGGEGVCDRARSSESVKLSIELVLTARRATGVTAGVAERLRRAVRNVCACWRRGVGVGVSPGRL